MTELLQKLQLHKTKANTLPVNILNEYFAGKRTTAEGKTLMQCFEPAATLDDRAKGTAIFQAYLEKYTATLPELIERTKGDNGKLSFQAMQVSTDFPLWTTNGNPLVMNLNSVDTGWTRAFRELRIDTGKKYAEFGEASHALEFFEIPEGHDYRGNDLTATKYTMDVKKLGMLYNITDETMLYNDFAANVDLMASIMNAYAKKMQSIHYGVLADSATTNAGAAIAWQAGASTLERDVVTINKAADYFYSTFRNKVDNSANTPLIMYVNGNDTFTTRLRQALATTNPVYTSSVRITGRPIELISTGNLATTAGVAIASTRAEFVLPGRLVVRATKRELQMERYRNYNNDTNVTKVNFICGAKAQDTTQTLFVDFA